MICKHIVLAAMLCQLGSARKHHSTMTAIAAGTTIAVNAIDARATVAKARAAARVSKRAVVKTARKVAGRA